MSTTNAFNTQSQDATTGKQQQQQPGYLDKAYNLLGSLSGSTDTNTKSRNQQPQVGGVGDMNTNSGADVARPAEERTNHNPFTSGGTSESLENPNITDANSIQQRLNARDPPNPYPEGNAGVGLSSDKQFHNKQDHVGGVGDLGTRSDADVVRLPEERANPDPLASAPGATNPFKDTTTSAATGFASTRDHNRDTTDTADTTSTQSHGWKPEEKSWDTRNVAGTLHDPTQHGHSGGVTGSNIDTDHGLGMPHRADTQRGNRDEGAIGQHQQKWAGATDFQSGRDGGNNADNRDQGVNERTQAPVGTTTSTNRHLHLHRDDEPLKADTSDQGTQDRTQAPFGGVDQSTTSTHPHPHHDRDDEAFNAGNRDQGMNERTRAAVGGVDHTTTSTHRHHDRDDEALNADNRDRDAHDRTQAPMSGVENTTTSTHRHHDRDNEALNADTRDRGAHDRTQVPMTGVENTTTSTHRHHDRDNEALNADTRDRGAHDRTQAPMTGVENTTTSTHRHHDRDNEALNADTRDRGAHDRTQVPVGGVDHSTTSAHRHPDRDVAMEERRDEDENASPTGKTGPGKLDKLHGKFMVAKGKLTKDPEAIAQGERLQTEGVTIRAKDILDERRE